MFNLLLVGLVIADFLTVSKQMNFSLFCSVLTTYVLEVYFLKWVNFENLIHLFRWCDEAEDILSKEVFVNHSITIVIPTLVYSSSYSFGTFFDDFTFQVQDDYCVSSLIKMHTCKLGMRSPFGNTKGQCRPWSKIRFLASTRIYVK